MKTVSQLLTYLESQGHGVTARELREAIDAEKRVTVADIERLSKMIEDIQRVDETLKRANELGIGHARAEERKRLQRAVAELRETAPHHIPQLLFHEALDAMGAILHVDSERGLTQWIDRETGDVVHERKQ